MKKTFPGYYTPTKSEFDKIWQDCLFVVDANVLLNLYRYSTDTSEKLINILKKVAARLWVPHQAAYEYQKNRLEVIAKQSKAYSDITGALTNARERLTAQLNEYARHPIIKVEQLLKKVRDLFVKIEAELKNQQKKHPDLLSNDTLRSQLTDLLEGKIGKPYASKELKEKQKQADERYQAKIPPGYEDQKKGGDEKYGDALLWFQIIDKAKAKNKPIIFVCDEAKEDWWWQFQGKTIGPRPELRQEMDAEASVPFYMYGSDQFMEHAWKYLNEKVDKGAIDEVRAVRRRDEEGRVRALAELLRKSSNLTASVNLADRKAELQTKISKIEERLRLLIGADETPEIVPEITGLKNELNTLKSNLDQTQYLMHLVDALRKDPLHDQNVVQYWGDLGDTNPTIRLSELAKSVAAKLKKG